MKKSELLKLLEQVPDDAEIVAGANGDDALGDYWYNSDLTIFKETARKGTNGVIKSPVSNYIRESDIEIEVWILS